VARHRHDRAGVGQLTADIGDRELRCPVPR
jgi:hypothetical protein